MIKMMCGVRLVDRVSTEVLRDRVGAVVKIEDTIIQSRQGWYDHAIDIIVIDMIMIMTLKRTLLLLSKNLIRIYQIQLLFNLGIDK